MKKASSRTAVQVEQEIQEEASGLHDTIRQTLIRDGLFQEHSPDLWRIARHPFPLSREDFSFFQQLGNHLLAFYRALNRLYFDSLRGHQLSWVHQYLDQGKPEGLLSFARMNRFRDLVPGVIRPDVIPTEQGMAITELDSVPGGIGLTGSLGRAYAQQGHQVAGGADGLLIGFANMIREAGDKSSAHLAIVVSDESESYRPEMQWLAQQLSKEGV